MAAFNKWHSLDIRKKWGRGLRLAKLELTVSLSNIFFLKELLESLCEVAENKFAISDIGEISEIKPKQQVMLARSMLTSLGQLKFRHRGCLDAITKLLTAKLEDAEGVHDGVVQNKDLSAFLLGTAALNYCPQNSEKLYQV